MTSPKRRPPTKKQTIKELVAIRKEQMERENAEANAKKNELWAIFSQKLKAHVLANFDKYASKIEISQGWRIQVMIPFRNINQDDEDRFPIPEELVADYKAWEAVELYPHGFRFTDADVRKKIQADLEKVKAASVIPAVKSSEPERTPVVKEYLEEFLTSLTKTSEAIDRLSAA